MHEQSQEPRHPAVRLFALIRRVEETVLSVSMLAIAGVTIANVFCRAVLNSSLTFAEEICQIFIIAATFFGLSYAASQGRHIRMTALYDQLPAGPKKRLMEIICASTSALLFLLAYHAIVYIETVHALGTVTPALQIPYWIVYLPVPAGLVLSGIQFALTLARNLLSPEIYVSFEHRDEYEEAPPPAV